MRRVFDYLRKVGLVGPRLATTDVKGASGKEVNGDGQQHDQSSDKGDVEICVLDADDMLDNPALMIESYCKSVGIPFEPDMLLWDTDEDHAFARAAFEKWRGFHDDAIASKELKARTHVSTITLCIPRAQLTRINYRARVSNPKRNSMPNGARNTAKRGRRSFGKR